MPNIDCFFLYVPFCCLSKIASDFTWFCMCPWLSIESVFDPRRSMILLFCIGEVSLGVANWPTKIRASVTTNVHPEFGLRNYYYFAEIFNLDQESAMCRAALGYLAFIFLYGPLIRFGIIKRMQSKILDPESWMTWYELRSGIFRDTYKTL